MKKSVFILFTMFISVFLCSCGDTSKIDSVIESSTELSSIEDNQDINSTENTEMSEYENNDSNSSLQNGEYDVDLTTLSPNMVYAQVYDMIYNGEKYNGMSVKAEGPFAYYKEKDGRELFAVVIMDATACCAQGIEFVLDGDYKYPEDYPEIGTEITITGKFNSYEEDDVKYCQLLDAEIEVK